MNQDISACPKSLQMVMDAIQRRQSILNLDMLKHLTNPPVIKGVQSIEHATKQQLAFLAHAKYAPMLASCQAGVVLVAPALLDCVPKHCVAIAVDDPYLAYACVSQLFEVVAPSQSIHPTAQIAPDAQIGERVSIGAYSVIGSGAIIETGVHIGNQVSIEAGAKIGRASQIHHGAMIGQNCEIGAECLIYAGAIIGSQGFGFAPSKNPSVDGWERIAQLGRVVIGQRVRIGANTCIDRGAIDDTQIGDDVIIDNLVQIAHNVKIGQGTAIAAQVGIAGSTRIGKGCIIGGAVGIAGHLNIADFVTLTGRSLVIKSIDKAGVYSSGTVAMPNQEWRRAAAKFRQLGKK